MLSLDQMFVELDQKGGIFRPSAFWRWLNQKNVEQLQRDGIQNIKRTLAQNYFTWVIGWRHDQFRHLVWSTRPGDWMKVFRDFPRYDPSTNLSRWKFAHLCIFTRMLFLYAQRFDPLKLLERLSEPLFGNPFPVTYRGRIISQDLINSILELYAMFEGEEIDFDAQMRVCEIGAGYGRNAFVFLSLFPNCQYTIIDIPPALYVAREYLSAVRPDANVRYLLPHEAAHLTPNRFDLLLNISSFHEMTPQQVEAYFELIDRTVVGRFYLKQWKSWHNPVDDVVLSEDGYPYPSTWKKQYSRTTPVQPSFFEAVYEI
jgi:putative sugar O-methyltransferase